VNIGTIINFFMSHNQLVFGVLLALILGLCSFLLYRMFFTESAEASNQSSGLNDGADIEATLKKILSQTAGIVPTVGGQPATPEQAADIEKLRAEIASNQSLIAELKTKATSAAAAGADQTPELLAKIKLLEDRLVEYEIIEDDIADLSIYKEENAKLKKELEALKGSTGAVLKNDVAASAIDAVAAASLVSSAPVDPGQVKTAVSAPAPEAAVPEAPKAAPVQAEPVAPVAASPEPEPATTSTTTTSTDNVKGSSDVFAEFQGEDADPLAGLGDLDADRMLEEIKDLGENAADAGVLNEDVDLEKMAKETSGKG
jgi:hypothetical protein